MSLTEKSTIQLEVKAVDTDNVGQPPWDVKVVAKNGNELLAGVPVRCRSHSLFDFGAPATQLSPDLATDADGKAECRLVEPPESQTHGPGLWLEAAPDGNGVTFSVAAYNGPDEKPRPLSGVRFEFRCPGGTLGPEGSVTTGSDGRATYKLSPPSASQ